MQWWQLPTEKGAEASREPAGEQSGDPGSRHLDRSLMKGLVWTGAVKWSGQIFSWLATIIVARLLEPKDYGVVAMAGVFMGFIALFNEFGLGAAVVALRHLSEDQIARLHSVACLLGIGGFFLSAIISGPAGTFFGSPDVPTVVIVSAIGFVLVGMRSVPSAICERTLRFKLLAILEGAQSLVTTAATVTLAWMGAGYWALVLGGLIGSASATVVLAIVHPVRPAWPSLQVLREAIQFSSHVLLGRVSWFIASGADVIVGGRMLGQETIGTYSFAANIANMPVDKIAALASRVMPTVYASVRNDAAALRRYFLLITEGVALITFPAGIGMLFVGPDFVAVVLGDKWNDVVLPMQIMAGWAAVRSIMSLQSLLLYNTGHSRYAMLCTASYALTYPVAFWVGSQYGIVGLALAWVIVQPLTWIAPTRRVFQVTQLTIRQYLSALGPAWSGLMFMALYLSLVQVSLSGESHAAQRLCAGVVGGAVVYGSVVMLLYKARVLQAVQVLRSTS